MTWGQVDRWVGSWTSLGWGRSAAAACRRICLACSRRVRRVDLLQLARPTCLAVEAVAYESWDKVQVKPFSVQDAWAPDRDRIPRLFSSAQRVFLIAW